MVKIIFEVFKKKERKKEKEQNRTQEYHSGHLKQYFSRNNKKLVGLCHNA